MERGELHDRCVCSLLADYIRDIGAAKPKCGIAGAQVLYLSAGYSDFDRKGCNVVEERSDEEVMQLQNLF